MWDIWLDLSVHLYRPLLSPPVQSVVITHHGQSSVSVEDRSRVCDLSLGLVHQRQVFFSISQIPVFCSTFYNLLLIMCVTIQESI